MTNTNLKELKKRFRNYCIDTFPGPIEEGEEIISMSIDWHQAWDFIETAVLEAEGSVIGNNILMTHEDYKKVIDLAQEDERKRIVEVVRKFKDEDVMKKQVLNGRSYYQDLIDDILRRIEEMK